MLSSQLVECVFTLGRTQHERNPFQLCGFPFGQCKRPVVAVTLRVFSEFRRVSVSVQATFDI